MTREGPTVADLETRLRATLTGRAAYLDDPAPYAVPPALVAGVAARAGQLRRRRTLIRVGGTAAAVAVIGLAAASQLRGPVAAGQLAPGASGVASASVVAAPRTVEASPARGAADVTAEDRIIRAALATDHRFPAGWGPSPQAVFGCGFYRLGASPDEAYRYVWANCSLFHGETVLSGISVPVRVHVRGTGAALEVLGQEIPGDGAAYATDVRRLFPAELVDTILGAPSTDIVRVADAGAHRDAREQSSGGVGSPPTVSQ
jgi:hypothetical protein